MIMDNKIIMVLVVVVAVLGGGYFLVSNMNRPSDLAQQNNESTNPTPTPAPSPIPGPQTYEVVYTDAGFAPGTLTIKVGDTVTFENQSSSGMWVGSAMHPSHTVYSGTALAQHCPDVTNTSFDECKSDASGTSWSFTFTKVGSWGYHNHSRALHFGKIIVE